MLTMGMTFMLAVVEPVVLLRQVNVGYLCLSDRLCHNAGHFNAYEGIQAGSVGCLIGVHRSSGWRNHLLDCSGAEKALV